MGNTTLKLSNKNRPAPKWFRKLKKALTIISDTSCVILLGLGYGEQSFIMLILRVGISGVLQTAEVLLANGEEYAPSEE